MVKLLTDWYEVKLEGMSTLKMPSLCSKRAQPGVDKPNSLKPKQALWTSLSEIYFVVTSETRPSSQGTHFISGSGIKE